LFFIVKTKTKGIISGKTEGEQKLASKTTQMRGD
jgi:hypothetical protein